MFTWFCNSILIVLLTAGSVSAQMVPVLTKHTAGQWFEPLQAIGGLTFAKRYDIGQKSLNADYCVGSCQATFTASRSASNPATYIDSDGVIQLTTTSNEPRWTSGYYDPTGYGAGAGLLLEGASTNLLKQSIFATDTDSDGVADNWGTEISGVTASLVDVSDLTGISGAFAQKYVLDGTEGNYYVSAQTVSVSADTIYTVSFWVKSSAWNGSVNRYAEITGDGSFGSTFLTFPTSNYTTGWIRKETTVTTTGTQTTLSLRLARETTGLITGTIWFFGPQIEQAAYPSSFIPTTTAALTRNTEALKYPISGNRTAAAETVAIKFTPLGGGFANDGVGRYLTDTDTKRRAIHKSTATSLLRYRPNLTDDATVQAYSSTSPSSETSYVAIGVFQHVSPYVNAYLDGTSESQYTTGDWTTNAWGTYFYVGVDNTGAIPLNGIIESVAIFNRALTADEVSYVTDILNQ